jgi:hypothetical protein
MLQADLQQQPAGLRRGAGAVAQVGEVHGRPAAGGRWFEGEG